MAGYRGAWAKARRARGQPQLAPPRDPAHSEPDNGDQVTRQTGPPLPTLPPGITGSAYSTPIRTGGGPIDRTPEDHSWGTGARPYLDADEARAHAATWRSRDMGSPAVRRWAPMARTQPVSRTQTDLAQGDGDSPDTLRLERTGHGQPHDPHARSPRKQRTRFMGLFDRWGWGVDWRPARVKQAAYADNPPIPAGTTSSHYTSPEASYGPWEYTPDKDPTPVERQAPQLQLGVPVAQPATGLTTWGL